MHVNVYTLISYILGEIGSLIDCNHVDSRVLIVAIIKVTVALAAIAPRLLPVTKHILIAH